MPSASSCARTTGTVVGFDLAHEVALVKAAQPFRGHVFDLTREPPAVGSDVAVIGYPLGGPESFTKGSVSGLERDIEVESGPLSGLIQTDTAINPGNSGGPLLDLQGRVLGLIEAKSTEGESLGYAVPASQAAARLSSWTARPRPVSVPHCDAATGSDQITANVTDGSGSPDGPALAEAFKTYATGINTGDYASACAVLSPRLRAGTSLEAFTQAQTSSYITDLTVGEVSSSAEGQDLVDVHVTSLQDPDAGGHGQDCSAWHLTEVMVEADSGWLIDKATALDGSPQPCQID